MKTKIVSTKPYFILWTLSILGACSVLPYTFYLGVLPASATIAKVVLSTILQATFFFGLICWLSYRILPKTDLQPFLLKNLFKQIVLPAIISGFLIGLALFFFDKTIFGSSLLSGVHPPFWTGALASLYGGINEEVLMRLFLFTLVYFLFSKFLKAQESKRLWILWTTNILVALLFGIGHLPAAFKLAAPSFFEVFRVLFLNGIAGIVFGWLYWTRGLWAAMIAHLVTDLVTHVFLI